MNDAAILGRLLRAILEPGTCMHCGCHAGACKIGGGELCGWAPSVIEKTLCNAPRCLATEAIQLRKEKREAEKKAAAAERAARIPWWARNKKAGWGAKKRRRKARTTKESTR